MQNKRLRFKRLAVYILYCVIACHRRRCGDRLDKVLIMVGMMIAGRSQLDINCDVI